jgi:aspartate/methionine/tyrosine aminotransferase
MLKKPSHRGDISSTARKLNLAATTLEAQGKKVIHSHLGAPSTGAPPKAQQALIYAMQHDIMGYSPTAGITPLRERIAQSYLDNYDVKINPDCIMVTAGASVGFMSSLLSWFDSGEKICLPFPVYGAYKNVIELMGLEFMGLSTSFENNFLPTLEDIQNLDEKPAGIVLVSPNNPSGSIISPEKLKEIIDYCEENNIKVISDEIYHGLIYDNKTKLQTAQAYSDNVISINSFSKYYSMPGWRLGWMVIPEYLIDSIGSCMRNMFIAPPTPSQYAAMAAFDSADVLDSHVQRYKHNRDIFVKGLPEAGFDRFIEPQGAFYIYVRAKDLKEDSKEFCMRMLNEIYITASPGSDFDPQQGKDYVRFCYAGSTESIEETVQRLKDWRNK